MKYKLCRALVAVVLACVLVVSWSPIRVQASALPEVAGVVTKVIPFAKVVEPAALGVGGTVFCWVAAALGLAFTAKEAVDAYNAYQDFTGDLETSIYYYPDGTWSYGVDVGFVDRVRAFLFHKGYVVDASKMVTTVPEGVAYGLLTPIVPCVAYRYSYHYITSGIYNVVSDAYLISLIPDNPYVVSTTTRETKTITDNGVKHYYRNVGHGIKKYSKAEFDEFMSQSSDFYHLGEAGAMYLQDVFNKYGWAGIVGNGDVSIGYVAPPAVPMIEAYPEWHTNSRPATNPDTEEEITVLPIPLNPSADPETQIGTLTQPDIWQGSIADPMPDADTNPDTGTDTDPDSGSTGTNPSTDINDYKIDLTQFFPFCLPFDIYAFFELLAADPEAPHLEFDIPFPYMEEPWHLVIDLSAWDNVAQLARRLELLGFIIGLCVFTREKFLRS